MSIDDLIYFTKLSFQNSSQYKPSKLEEGLCFYRHSRQVSAVHFVRSPIFLGLGNFMKFYT